MTDAALIANFAGTFSRGGVSAVDVRSDPASLLPLASRLPARLPPLYEALILSYRWPREVDLGILRLLPNPGRSNFDDLTEAILGDPVFVRVLIPGGFIPIGRGTHDSYDPVCFDYRSRRRADGNLRVVRLDHEAILCHERIGELTEVAPSFRALMCGVIAAAGSGAFGGRSGEPSDEPTPSRGRH